MISGIMQVVGKASSVTVYFVGLLRREVPARVYNLLDDNGPDDKWWEVLGRSLPVWFCTWVVWILDNVISSKNEDVLLRKLVSKAVALHKQGKCEPAFFYEPVHYGFIVGVKDRSTSSEVVCKVWKFCISLRQVVEIQKLDVSHNSISALSDRLGDLGSLTFLNVSHNQLRFLPPAIGKWAI